MADENAFKRFFESLQDIEFSELDLEDVGRWPLVVRLLAVVLVFVLVVGFSYQLLVSSNYKALKSETVKTLELREKYTVATRNAANLEEYQKQMERIEHEFSVLVSQLPNDTEVPGLLDDITDEGVGNGLDFSSIGLEPEKETDVYIELPIKINVRGGYHNIASFVSGIASLSRIVTLHDFTILPESAGSVILKMDLLAKTYRYNEAKQNADAATPTEQKK